jgi:hypothetical protein
VKLKYSKSYFTAFLKVSLKSIKFYKVSQNILTREYIKFPVLFGKELKKNRIIVISKGMRRMKNLARK